ncbi:hypothetical protein POJ06DRAFT_255833 [Lipomyces tetrasporus]|uniref:Uncharacterized protein n=1 Tax=Lipomyces tetrasporus TaxID=54092 RepID=A0AAD7VRV1_9ASCO|nr:uncharacterized protein POJ06DRAFT_255833 [Lipomyces tetrasporus]KAJ8099054.1 hypothetical protein POJ06DRAFT_255833 [Lipomyces tetrasporus]
MFGMSPSWLCLVFRDVIDHLVRRYRRKLEWDDHRLTLDCLMRYAEAVRAKCSYPGVWSFVDGTLRPIFCSLVSAGMDDRIVEAIAKNSMFRLYLVSMAAHYKLFVARSLGRLANKIGVLLVSDSAYIDVRCPEHPSSFASC